MLDKLSKFIIKVSAVAGCVLLAVDIADITLGVIARQSGGTSIVWTEEVARFALVWFVLIGAAATFAAGDHMSIDFVVNAMPDCLKKACRLISFLIQAFIMLILIYYGWQNVMGGWTMRTMALRIPRAVPLMAVPLGAGMLLIVMIAHYFKFTGARSADEESAAMSCGFSDDANDEFRREAANE